MSWTVEAHRDSSGRARVKVSYSEYDADMNQMLPSEANRLANQLLIVAAQATAMNKPPLKAPWK